MRAVVRSKLGISGTSAQLFPSMTNVAGCRYVIKVFSLQPPHVGAEAVIKACLMEDLHQQGDWNKPGASAPVRQAAVCCSERREHKLRRRWPEFSVPTPSWHPIVVFVLERTMFASSQGLAGISDQRHPAASSPGPKSMSTVKHSAGKVLHNQMGFALTQRFFFSAFFLDCSRCVDPIWPSVIYSNWIFCLSVCL